MNFTNFTDQYIKMCDCDEVFNLRPQHLKDLYPTVSPHTPAQGDIQLWIHQYGNCDYRLLMDFFAWCEEYDTMCKGRSIEEMWLMYYMWREHSKIWDGDKWIKE